MTASQNHSPTQAANYLVDLIRCRSVTPVEGGALDYIEAWARARGFTTHRLPRGMDGPAPSDNLYARLGNSDPHFCFAGHTDVVPPGVETDWSLPPFSGEIKDGVIYGRGAVDMKGGIACFMAAVDQLLARGDFAGSVSLLITGDEEGPALNGTKAVVDWMREKNEIPTVCLVGEPTNPASLSDAVKIGRRGSMTSYLSFKGTQGHSAYPHLANNPINAVLDLLDRLAKHPLDAGSDHFPASNLEVVSVDVGNPANNVIPATASAVVNIRFNDHHSGASLSDWLRSQAAQSSALRGVEIEQRIEVSGESFVFEPGQFGSSIADAVEAVTGQRPEYSTTGGTSDARFIKNICPVAEYGLVGKTMHKVDECAAVADLDGLTQIYARLLTDFYRLRA